jgi:tetratricopeptide (TPR) repeat protein
MKLSLLCLIALVPCSSFSQLNCNVYKLNNNEPCYQACMLANEAADQQGTRASQEKFDKAIELCPALDYCYFEKSVPYLKRGEFITWKKLIDQAVALNPSAHLGYRGWCRYQFVHDYRGAIRDFEKLDSIRSYDIGYSQNGDYHLNFAKALCYKAIGEKRKAISIMEAQLSEKEYSPMPYDYLHLGVAKLEVGDIDSAIENLKKSIAWNDYLAEPYFYLALAYREKNLPKETKENLEKAKTYYLKGYKRLDPYTNPMDKVYLADIERELSK